MKSSKNENLIILVEPILIILPIAFLFSNLISEGLILLLVGIFFINVNKYELSQIINNKIIIFFIIFYFYLVSNYFVNISKEPSFLRSIFFIRFIFYVISLNYFLKKKYINPKKIFLYWGLTTVLICLDLQLQNIFGKNIFGYESIMQGNLTRLGGFLNNELKIAYLINNFFVISLGAYLFFNKMNNKVHQTLILVFISLIVFSIYSTGERANFICLLFFVFCILIFSRFRVYFLSLVIILIPIIFLNYSDLQSNPKINRMFVNIIEQVKKNISPDTKSNKNFLYKENHYFSHYSTAWQIYKDFPLFGVGLKNFRIYCDNETYDKKIPVSFRGRNCATHPHNVFFEIISELGFIGFIIFYSFFGYFFFKSFSYSFKERNIFVFGNTIFLITYFIPFLPRGSFFSNWNAMLFWTIFGVTIYLISNKNNPTSKNLKEI